MNQILNALEDFLICLTRGARSALMAVRKIFNRKEGKPSNRKP